MPVALGAGNVDGAAMLIGDGTVVLGEGNALVFLPYRFRRHATEQRAEGQASESHGDHGRSCPAGALLPTAHALEVRAAALQVRPRGVPGYSFTSCLYAVAALPFEGAGELQPLHAIVVDDQEA